MLLFFFLVFVSAFSLKKTEKERCTDMKYNAQLMNGTNGIERKISRDQDGIKDNGLKDIFVFVSSWCDLYNKECQ